MLYQIKAKQAFRFMVGQGHCPMISKYGPSLSKAVGLVDPSFLVVENLTLIKKNIHLTAILITNGSLMMVKRFVECSPSAILLTSIKQ